MKRTWALSIFFVSCVLVPAKPGPVSMANGIKIGEVTQDQAIIWVRLTQHAERKTDGIPFLEKAARDQSPLPTEKLDSMNGSVPGANGEVQLTYWPAKPPSTPVTSKWYAVDPDQDFTHTFAIKGLVAGAEYRLELRGRGLEGAGTTCKMAGRFRTAPPEQEVATVRFAVSACQGYWNRDHVEGPHIYSLMKRQALDFFVHAGDAVYYDKARPFAATIPLARFKWNRMYALPRLRALHATTASYFLKDDHDTLKNDCWPGQHYGKVDWEAGLAIHREQNPIGYRSYRTIRWGKDLQIWLMEGREFRSPNTMVDGPGKTIWGARQKQWLFETVRLSDASFRVVISPTPILGPEQKGKSDNHATEGFRYEGEEVRAFLRQQKNLFLICGDRHWQAVHKDTRSDLVEFACGPSTDKHAGGFDDRDRTPMHSYVKVKGGYLDVSVQRVNDTPIATVIHYGVDGLVLNKVVLTAQD